MQDIYCFPAVFSYDDDGIGIVFPDLGDLTTEADTTEQALFMAADALEGRLYLDERENENIPAPSDLFELKKTLNDNQIVVPVRIDMIKTRAKFSKKSANKMVTLPQWLLAKGIEENINFSKLMQKALMRELGIKDTPRH